MDNNIRLIERIRWPNGVRCIGCKSANVGERADKPAYVCCDCGRQFTVTSGTIFEGSFLPVAHWFHAIDGYGRMGPTELASVIGVTYRTAWLMLHRIRLTLEIANKTSR